MEERLIAPCGMNCALCVSYQAMKQGLREKGFAKAYCPGCLPRGKGCLFLKDSCARLGVGQVRFCFECPEYPCPRLRALDRRYRAKYHMGMLENLERIRDWGIGDFLLRQEEEWRCPACGGEICCHNGLCLRCSADVLKKDPGYRWGTRQPKQGSDTL